MVDGELFDTLTKLADQLRNKRTDKPFGGIQVCTTRAHICCDFLSLRLLRQLVVTGDFFQLPPVTKSGAEPFFAFESESWKKCIDHTVTLTEVYRQRDTRKAAFPLIALYPPSVSSRLSRIRRSAQ